MTGLAAPIPPEMPYGIILKAVEAVHTAAEGIAGAPCDSLIISAGMVREVWWVIQ